MNKKIESLVGIEKDIIIAGSVSFFMSLFSLLGLVYGEPAALKFIYILVLSVLYTLCALVSYRMVNFKMVKLTMKPVEFMSKLLLFALITAGASAIIRFSAIYLLDICHVELFKAYYINSSYIELFQLWTIPTVVLLSVFCTLKKIVSLESKVSEEVSGDYVQETEAEEIIEAIKKVEISGKNKNDSLTCSFSELVSIESQGHYATISLFRDGRLTEFKFRNSISDLLMQIKIQDGQKHVMQVSRSILVNLKYVEEILDTRNEVIIAHRIDTVKLTDFKKRKLKEKLDKIKDTQGLAQNSVENRMSQSRIASYEFSR